MMNRMRFILYVWLVLLLGGSFHYHHTVYSAPVDAATRDDTVVSGPRGLFPDLQPTTPDVTTQPTPGGLPTIPGLPSIPSSGGKPTLILGAFQILVIPVDPASLPGLIGGGGLPAGIPSGGLPSLPKT